jgi:putative RNA ligase
VKYKFPVIEHIDQVIPAIEGNDGFRVIKKDNYDVVSYVNMIEAFDPAFLAYDGSAEAIRRECRGLMFNKQGEIIRRPFHKFFNINERAETKEHEIDWHLSYQTLEKLDGSMVTPFFDQGKYIRWATKMGITSVAMQAECFVGQNHNYIDFADHMLTKGFTPIFEWCSPQQQIVIRYPKDNLILTAIRNMKTGEYADHMLLNSWGRSFGIPVVGILDMPADWCVFGEGTDIEGTVIRFDNGHMLKLKTDWYVRIHKAVSGLVFEKDILAHIYNETLDDLLPFLNDKDKEEVLHYAKQVRYGFQNTMEQVLGAFEAAHRMGRKNFGLSKDYPHMVRAVVFDNWQSELESSQIIDVNDFYKEELQASLMEKVKKHLNTQTNVDKIRSVVHARPWKFRGELNA